MDKVKRELCTNVVVISSLLLSAIATNPLFAEDNLRPLTGPVLVVFDDAVGGLAERQFGVFRDLDPPNVQFIEEVMTEIKPPRKKEPTAFLALLYNVTAPGSYNGWWLKLDNADWSRYTDGEIVVRLRQLDPTKGEFRRSVRLKEPDTRCTDSFKLELKTIGPSGKISVVPLRMRITQAHKKQQHDLGYFDLRVPLADFGLDLTKMHELVIVFENNSFLPSQYRGGLAIRAIVLTAERGEDIEKSLDGARS